jgi:tRNA A-37 threonylcarbamoyl transferase component Bud32
MVYYNILSIDDYLFYIFTHEHINLYSSLKNLIKNGLKIISTCIVNMSIVEFVDYDSDNDSANIKIINNTEIDHPHHCVYSCSEDDEEYPIEKIYYGSSELLLSKTTINIGDYIYDAAYDNYTVYPATINGIDKYVLKKVLFKLDDEQAEEKIINEIKLQNRAAEFGLSDPIILAYSLENEKYKEYGLIMKKYETSLFSIFDCEYYDLEEKIKYVDRIKIMLENLADTVKISHGDFNLDNIMVDEENNIKLVEFGNGFFLDDESKKDADTENFNNCNFYLDTISEQVTFDLQNYWYEIMNR